MDGGWLISSQAIRVKRCKAASLQDRGYFLLNCDCVKLPTSSSTVGFYSLRSIPDETLLLSISGNCPKQCNLLDTSCSSQGGPSYVKSTFHNQDQKEILHSNVLRRTRRTKIRFSKTFWISNIHQMFSGMYDVRPVNCLLCEEQNPEIRSTARLSKLLV